MATATAATASTAAAAAATAPLNAVADKYEGVIVDPSSLPETTADFVSSLDASLAAWRLQGVRGVWLKLPATTAHPARHWVGHALDAGFRLHHAERDYVMLTHWLPGGEDRLPPNASTQCGIGAFVLNDKREILVVQEASGPLRGAGVWKMPTGLVQQGEDISDAAEREIFEETGVRARFQAVLAMRQAHGFAHGKSDIFFVVALKLEPGPQNLIRQEEELDALRWMPLDEYLELPFTANRPLFRQVNAVCLAWANGTYRGLSGRKLDTGMSARRDLLIFGEELVEGEEGGKGEEDAWIGLGAGDGAPPAAA